MYLKFSRFRIAERGAVAGGVNTGVYDCRALARRYIRNRNSFTNPDSFGSPDEIQTLRVSEIHICFLPQTEALEQAASILGCMIAVHLLGDPAPAVFRPPAGERCV